jgi:hypothetical protein
MVPCIVIGMEDEETEVRFSLYGPAFMALALASCSGSSDNADTDGDGKISAEEAAGEVKKAEFNPGQYEKTTEFVDITFDESKLPPEQKKFIIPTIESMRGQKFTEKRCMTPEEAKDPREEFFLIQDGQQCEYERYSLSGGKIDLAMNCASADGDGGKVTAKGSFTDESYTMDMTMATTSPEQGDVVITAKTSAKRIGECKS